MPNLTQSADLMAVGKKGGGKHYTQAEVDARKAAAEGSMHKGKVIVMIPPPWLSEDALKIWKRVRRQTRGLELLDNLNTEMLAVYCDAVTKYQESCKKLDRQYDEDGERAAFSRSDIIKEIQAWARIISAFADKLGFTPAARARLVKKKADEILDDFGSEFDK
jgi:P27 family predicted phage terminase small subunit